MDSRSVKVIIVLFLRSAGGFLGGCAGAAASPFFLLAGQVNVLIEGVVIFLEILLVGLSFIGVSHLLEVDFLLALSHHLTGLLLFEGVLGEV